jgi:deoxyadenosine/deoxycytidine kinase
MVMIISIEGNIGSGKSTFVSYLSKTSAHTETVTDTDITVYTICGKSITFVPEPVSDWKTICDEDGTPMLNLFYADQKRNAFSFQMMAYISRLVAIRRAVRSGVDIVITERCLYTDREVFVKMLHEDKMIRRVDYEIYRRWFEEFATEVQPDHFFYIAADPVACLGRVRKRSRGGEDSIPLKYLERCHMFHEAWLQGDGIRARVHTLDGNSENTAVDQFGDPHMYAKWKGLMELVIREDA